MKKIRLMAWLILILNPLFKIKNSKGGNVLENVSRVKLHFLHIGKTGGTAIKEVLKRYLESSKYIIILHGHSTSLKDIPKGELVFFFLRDPISRFVSGFYSRQRKGQPRYNSDWNEYEKKVFNTFTTPNEVALALADPLSKEYEIAKISMQYVQHFRPYKDWYIDFQYFESRLEDIFFIGFQESLEKDFETLKNLLEIPLLATLPTDDIGAHKNPKDIDKFIDADGINALQECYRDDFIFFNRCKELMV
jgi:hypothetical protein